MSILTAKEDLRRVLLDCRTIAVVGISPVPHKPSYFVAEALKSRGFKIYLVNPNHAGEEILGEKVHACLKDIPDEIDIIDVFRRPSAVPALAEEAREKGFKVFWMQPGTESPEAVSLLEKDGCSIVAGRCTKVESAGLRCR